jgi:hypothetical protein
MRALPTNVVGNPNAVHTYRTRSADPTKLLTRRELAEVFTDLHSKAP